MWKKLDKPVPIDPSQVVVGLYVWLDVTWDKHPFFSSRVMVKTEKEVAIIKSLDVAGKFYYYPEQSTAQPNAVVPVQVHSPDEDAAEATQKAAVVAEILALEKEII